MKTMKAMKGKTCHFGSRNLCVKQKNRKFANGEKNSDEEVRRKETGRHESDEDYEGYEREEVIVTCFTIDSEMVFDRTEWTVLLNHRIRWRRPDPRPVGLILRAMRCSMSHENLSHKSKD